MRFFFALLVFGLVGCKKSVYFQPPYKPVGDVKHTMSVVLEPAAESKGAAALFEAGGEMYNVCLSCHQIYWVDQPGRN